MNFQRIKEKYHEWRRTRHTRKLLRESGGVPTTLVECFSALDRLMGAERKAELKASPISELPAYHFGLGMWLRNNWGLWGGSPLKDWFTARGIHHADDMSATILTSYWRALNGLPIELDEQIAAHRRYWADQGVDPDTLQKR